MSFCHLPRLSISIKTEKLSQSEKWMLGSSTSLCHSWCAEGHIERATATIRQWMKLLSPSLPCGNTHGEVAVRPTNSTKETQLCDHIRSRVKVGSVSHVP